MEEGYDWGLVTGTGSATTLLGPEEPSERAQLWLPVSGCSEVYELRELQPLGRKVPLGFRLDAVREGR